MTNFSCMRDRSAVTYLSIDQDSFLKYTQAYFSIKAFYMLKIYFTTVLFKSSTKIFSDSDINHMYVFDSYMLILCKSIVSLSIHEDLHAFSKPLGLQIWSIDQFPYNIVLKQY